MKKTHSLIAALIALTLLVSLMSITAYAAGGAVTSTLDFTAMTQSEDKDAVKAQLEAAGLFEVNNLFLKGNHEPIVNPGGFNGAGYIIHKLEAPAGKTLGNAALELGYWICNADNQGYIEVHVSANNTDYTKVWECKEGNGAAFENTRRTANISIPVAAGQTTLYVKIVMEHWSTYEGAGVAISNVTANVAGTQESGTGTGSSVANNIDFTAMTQSEDKDAVKAQLEAAGLLEVNNLFLKGNHEGIVNPGGFNGAGYIIQKLEAPAGKTLEDAALELGYWICNSDNQGYIEVHASANNADYTKVWECREGNGPAFENTRRTANIDIPVAADQTELYVKIVMEHWSTYEGAGVAISNVTANVAGGDTTPTTPAGTGDPIAIVVAVLTVSAAGLAIVSKKKIR